MSKVRLGSYGGLKEIETGFGNFATGWINKQTRWPKEKKRDCKRVASNIFAAAVETLHDNVQVRGADWDDFGADTEPKKMELKSELIEIQRQVMELVDEVLPLRAKAASTILNGTALPQSVLDNAVKLSETASTVDKLAPTQPQADTATSAQMHRVTSALVSLKQLGARSQQVAHSLAAFAGAAADQAVISSGEASDRAKRDTTIPAVKVDSLCTTTSWCCEPANHDGPCTALPAPEEAVATAQAACVANEDESKTMETVEKSDQLQTKTAAKAEKNENPRKSKAVIKATPPKSPPATAAPEPPRSETKYEEIADPFATAAKVLRTPRAVKAAMSSSPVRRSPRNHTPKSSAVTASPLRSSTRRRPAKRTASVAAARDDDTAAAFQGRGLARTPIVRKQQPATDETNGRAAKRHAAGDTPPGAEAAGVSPIAPVLDTTFTKDDDANETFVVDESERSSAAPLGESSTSRKGQLASVTVSTPRRSPARSASKRVRTPIVRTPRSTTAPRSSSRLRNSVGRV